MSDLTLTCLVAALTTAGVVARPLGLNEAVWAVAGAVLLVALRLLPPGDALTGIANGTDVYLFLAGMLLLAESAREAGLFVWLAAVATRRARGSPARLFGLVYLVGIVVTTLLSNDATAVVLTPAVAAAARTARAPTPLPYLLVCAFVANAASFVLPISNPANLVIYRRRMPPLLDWLPLYLTPSVLAIGATYCVLRWTQRRALRGQITLEPPVAPLTRSGRAAAFGIAGTAIVLLAASAMGLPLGAPTALAGTITAALVLIGREGRPWAAIRAISWGVIPLAAGLFVIVTALERAGLSTALSGLLQSAADHSVRSAAWVAGGLVGLVCNIVNNLPAGLLAGSVLRTAHAAAPVTAAALIGVDVGPNLSVTGSLATILWLAALRREGERVGPWTYFKLGVLVMPPALLLGIGAVLR